MRECVLYLNNKEYEKQYETNLFVIRMGYEWPWSFLLHHLLATLIKIEVIQY